MTSEFQKNQELSFFLLIESFRMGPITSLTTMRNSHKRVRFL